MTDYSLGYRPGDPRRVGDPQTATEPAGQARQLARLLWEHHRAFMEQGFTEAQSLTLLGTWIGTMSAGLNGQTGNQAAR